jgi:putative transposase
MRRTTISGEINFITITVVDWVDIFTRVEYKDFIVQCLNHCQKNKGLNILAYVIMSNHLHLVVKDTTIPLSDILRDFKSYTSKELFKKIESHPQESRKRWMTAIFKKRGSENALNLNHQIWQNENYPVALINEEMLRQKIDYIHNNPVRAGLVNESFEYLYSSAHPFSPLKVMEV